MGRLDKLLHQGDFEAAFAFYEKQASPGARSDSMHKIARSLPGIAERADFGAIIDRAAALARGSEWDSSIVSGLAVLVENVLPHQQEERARLLLDEALDVAAGIPDDYERDSALSHLIYLLQNIEQHAWPLDLDSVFARAIGILRTISGTARRQRAEHLARELRRYGREGEARAVEALIDQDPEIVPKERRRKKRILVDAQLMASLVEDDPIDGAELARIREKHAGFLAENGVACSWRTFVTESGLVLGVYMGGASSAGQAKLNHQRFSGALLAGANLACAEMVGVHCVGQDLRGASLENALCIDGDWHDSDFTGATLARADFSRSLLNGCSFRDADLRGTDFEDADLRGADFTGARLDGVKFKDADLTGAKGLPDDAAGPASSSWVSPSL